MKKFTAPEMDVLKFAVEDIINASTETEETEPAFIGDCIS